MILRKRQDLHKKLLPLALLVCLIFVTFFALVLSPENNLDSISAEVWDGEVSSAFAGGDGNSAQTAYQISNAGELAYLAYLINNNVQTSYNNAFYKLTADIVLNDLDEYPIWGTSFAPVFNWIPIGNNSYPFGGNFDGNGYTVKGMYVNCTTEDYKGLFGKATGVIKNVGIEESYVAGKAYVGGVVGYCSQYVGNCYNKGTVYAAGTNCGGIAGYVGAGGYIEDCYNLGKVSGAGQYVGGVLGQLQTSSSYINNCYNSGSVEGSNKGVGGVVGYNEYGKIVNTINSGSIAGTSQYIGGIVGRSNGTVANSMNSGAVSANGASSSTCNSIGGIVGYNEGSGYLYNSYNIGTIVKHTENTTALIGGIVGYNTNSVNYSYSLRNTSSDLSLIGSSSGTLNEVKSFSSTGQFKYNPLDANDPTANTNCVTINSVTYYTLQTALSAWVSYLNSVSTPSPAYLKWLSYSTKMPILSPWSGEVATAYYNGGDGSELNPFKISTAEQFAYFRSQINLGATAGLYFELVNNIKLNNTMYANDWINYSLSQSEYILNEWTPIGTAENPFNGIFNGNGYIISGVYVNNAQGAQSGLFGENIGTIKNVILANSFIRGGQSSAGIVGHNLGTISSSINLSNVLADTSSGGIAGINSGIIRNCVNLGAVTGISTADNIGGIVGSNYGASQNAVVENSSNRGEITSSVSNTCVGGIAGQSYGSYAKVKNCYNYGEIVASGLKYGAIAGYSNNSDIWNCYYLTGTAVKSVGSTANTNVPLDCCCFDEYGILGSSITITGTSATSSLKVALNNWICANGNSALYIGWSGADFMPMLSITRNSVAHTASAMPKPQNWSGNQASAFAGGNGSAIDPYQISTAEQLKYFSSLVNSGSGDYFSENYVLTNNISLNASSSYTSWTSSTTGLSQWTPIGTEAIPFSGVFDGNGYKISGIFISGSGTYKGLFGKNSGTIHNVTVIESFVSGADKIGLIAGDNAGVIDNNMGVAVISALGGSAGGLAGQNQGTVESSYFKGTINGSASASNVGGIVGLNLIGGSLFTLSNSAALNLDGTASGDAVYTGGGIVGLNQGSVANCYNSGNITVVGTGTANYRLGGIAGLNDEEISNSINLGTVKSASAYSQVGGIVGINTKTLSNCVNIPDTHSVTGGYSNAGRIEGGIVKTTSSCFYQYDHFNVGVYLMWNSNNTQYTAENIKAYLNAWAINANNKNLTFPLKYYFWQVYSGATMPTMSRVTVKNVSFDLNGGVFKETYSAPTVYYIGVSNNSLPLRTNVNKAEFSLKGWHLNADLSDSIVTNFSVSYKGDITFYAEWTSELTEITFDKQEGLGGSDTVTATNGLPMPTFENEEAVTAPTMEGYTFSGYFSETDGAGTKYYDENMASATDWNKSGIAEFTLYAYWTINIYEIYYSTTDPGFSVTCPASAEHLTQIDLTVAINEHYRQSTPKITVDGGETYIENSGVSDYVYSFSIPSESVTSDLFVAVADVSLDKFIVTFPTEIERTDAERNEIMYNIVGNSDTQYHSTYSFEIEFLGEYFYFETAPDVTMTPSSGVSSSISGVRKVIEGETCDYKWIFTIEEGIVEQDFSIAVAGITFHVHDYVETSRVEPTCEDDGYIEYTCFCNRTYREVLPALGFTINFDKQEGTGGTDTVNAKIALPMPTSAESGELFTAPEKVGYTFSGYFSETSGAGKQYYLSDMTSANNWDKNETDTYTLYAYWIIKIFNIDYNTGDPAYDINCQGSAQYLSQIDLTVAINAGYTQSVPRITVDGGENYIEYSSVSDYEYSFTVPSESVTRDLYIAVTDVNPDKFNITLPTESEKADATHNDALMYNISAQNQTEYHKAYSFTITFEKCYSYFENDWEIILTSSSNVSYAVSGARKSTLGVVSDTIWIFTVAKDIIEEDFSVSISGMRYQALTTTITLDKQGGTSGADMVTADRLLSMPTSVNGAVITAPEKVGYTFSGYFSEENGAGIKYYDEDMSSAHTWDQNDTDTSTLYAYWIINRYEINFGGSNTSYSVNCQDSAEYLSEVTCTVEIKKGYYQSIPKITLDGGETYIESSGVVNYLYTFIIPSENVTHNLNVEVSGINLDKFSVTFPTESERTDTVNHLIMYSVLGNLETVYHANYSFEAEFSEKYIYFDTAPCATLTYLDGTDYEVSGVRKTVGGVESDSIWVFTVANNLIEQDFSVSISGATYHVHNFVETSRVEPTCEEDGYIEYTCSVCGEKKITVLPAKGHTPGAEADCTHDQICTVCGKVLKPALGHDWIEATYDAPKTCRRCGLTVGYPLTRVEEINGVQEANLTMRTDQNEADFLVADIDRNKNLTVRFAGGSISFDQAVLGSISTDNKFSVSLKYLSKDILTDAEKNIVNGLGEVYDIEISVNGSNVSSLPGNVILSLPYSLSEGQDDTKIQVWYLNLTSGKLEPLSSAYDKESGTVSFSSNHLSKYVIGYGSIVPAPVPENNTALIIGLSLGGAAILAVIIVVVIVLSKKKKKDVNIENKKADNKLDSKKTETKKAENKKQNNKKLDNKKAEIPIERKIETWERPKETPVFTASDIRAAAMKRDITAGVVKMRTFSPPPSKSTQNKDKKNN